ncbi:pre-rRNA-processing protein TSR2, putative, partial [Hepatocystis sp. ex Piliocolobus tephrosceles]
MFTDNENLLLEGINLLFDKWTVLCLAVENNWGGIRSEEKKKSLIKYVHSYLLSNNLSKDKLSEYLKDEMSSLFNVELEDESE